MDQQSQSRAFLFATEQEREAVLCKETFDFQEESLVGENETSSNMNKQDVIQGVL